MAQAELVQLTDLFAKAAKTAGNTLCINEDFGKIWREYMPASKGSVPDVREEILNRLLQSPVFFMHMKQPNPAVYKVIITATCRKSYCQNGTSYFSAILQSFKIIFV